MFKVLIASRRLFSNWLSAGIRYYLVKYGTLKGGIKVKCGNKEHVLSPRVYLNIVNAYYGGLLRDFSCSNKLLGKPRGVIDFVIRDGDVILRMPDGILLTIESFDQLVLSETWLNEIHFLGSDLSDWFVLDVGAYIGDTALYYAKRGAFVVAVEPLPSNYEVMLKNLELNPELKTRILPINAAISSKDGFVELNYVDQIDGSATTYGAGIFKSKVRSMKLSTLVREIASTGMDPSKFRVRVLKMDCKGCEYDIIHEIDTLKLFDIIKIEYSGYLRGKTYHELKKTLEDLGFKCRIWAHNEWAIRIGLDKHGTMTCTKNYEAIR